MNKNNFGNVIRVFVVLFGFVFSFGFFIIFSFYASPIQEISESNDTVEISGSAYFILTETYINDIPYDIEEYTNNSFVIIYYDAQGEENKFKIDIVDSDESIKSEFEYSSSSFMALGKILYHNSGSITFEFTRIEGNDDSELFIEIEDYGSVNYTLIYILMMLLVFGLILVVFMLTRKSFDDKSEPKDNTSLVSISILQKILVILLSLIVPT